MDTVEQPGRAIGRDIAKGEATEKELDVFISKRHADRVRDEGERSEEEAWMASERRHEAARRASNASAWYEYHRDQAEGLRRILEGLIASHEQEAEKLVNQPKGSAA